MKYFLMLIALLIVALFVRLGFWQLDRAHQKEYLLKQYRQTAQKPMTDLTPIAANPKAHQYFFVQVTGHFDLAHPIFLDNQFYNHLVGYHVIYPFILDHDRKILLVDRGWIPRGDNYEQLPILTPVLGTVTLLGRVNLPTHNPLISKNFGKINLNWPIRVQEINIKALAQVLQANLYPFVLMLEAKSPGAFQTQLPIINMTPARHRAYAFQWFAMALALVIICSVLFIRSKR